MKALYFLQQGVDLTIFPNIMLAKTLMEAWKILESKFKDSNKIISIKLQSLWRNFDTLTIFFSRISSIINQIRSYMDMIEDKNIIQKILRGFPSRFNYVVTAIKVMETLVG